MPKPLVGVVVLNWNGLELTQKCLAALEKQSYASFAVVVVDNGSSDGSVGWLSGLSDTHTIFNRRNRGFAKAINQGIEKVVSLGCRYVVTLNNDAFPDRDWLKTLVDHMERNPRTGFAQGANKQFEKKELYDSTGIYLEKGFIPNQRALGKSDPCLDLRAIGPNAAGAIYRSGMLKDVRMPSGDFFDGRFFAYVEDVDLDLRCTLRGYEFDFVENAKLSHMGSATGNRISKKKMYWGARNLVWLVYKNASGAVFRKSRRMILKSHMANLQFLWREQRSNFVHYLAGLLIGVMFIGRFRKDRKINLRSQKLSDDEFLELLTPSNPPLSNPLKKLTGLVK